MTERSGTRRLLIGLNLLPWLEPADVERATARFRDPEDALVAPDCELEDALRQVGHTEEVREALERADLEEMRATELGARIVTWAEPEYPCSLRVIADPPPVLYVRGTPQSLLEKSVAVVGARKATPYGRRVAADLGRAIARGGATVVSGLARGVDAAAHRGALEAGGWTVAVLGNGIDRVYPPEHRELADQVARSGALVTEFPLETEPLPQNFPRRNRVLSGLASVVVVVEAAGRSGSLVTAGAALVQGKQVFAVPGSIYSPASWGTNSLIQDGAAPVLGVDFLMTQLDLPGEGEPLSASEEEENPVLERMGWEPITIEELGHALGEPPARLAGLLLSLELQGRIARLPGDWVQRLR
jgi:DNA processing protein